MDVEAVRKRKNHAGAQIRLDVLVIHRRLLFVVDQNHDHICDLSGFRRGHDGQTGVLRLLPALAAFIQRNDHIAARIAKIQRMRMTLGTIADDGNLLAHQVFEVAILSVKHLCHFMFLLFFVWGFSQIYPSS